MSKSIIILSMKVIVGLGNPGEQYKNSRHNVGYMFIDYVESLKSIKSKILLFRPQTFMNESGKAVKACVTRYALNVTHDLYIVHDDLDLRLGEFKIQKGKGPKLHGGLLSVQNELSTNDFWRVRLGVDDRSSDNRLPGEAYVLQDLTEGEKAVLASVFPKVWQELLVT